MTNLQGQLASIRSDKNRQRLFNESYPKKEAIMAYTELAEYPLHEGQNSAINTLDIHQGNRYIITGGKDSRVVLFDKEEKRIVKRIEAFDIKKKGNSSGVTVSKFVPGQKDLYAILA